jgi:hypothetical protein
MLKMPVHYRFAKNAVAFFCSLAFLPATKIESRPWKGREKKRKEYIELAIEHEM